MILLDTNVISALMHERVVEIVAAWLDRQPRQSIWATSVNVMEVRLGLAIMPEGRRREARRRGFERLLRQKLAGRIASFDTASAEEAARLTAERRRRGIASELRDTMIAGIAISRHATLATRNLRHFDDLPTPVVDPWAAP